MERDYLQEALQTFNGGNWYGWKKIDSNGDKIPNDQRMTYENVEIIKEGATLPTEAEVNAKILEIKQNDIDIENALITGKEKLKNLGLTDIELKAIMGI
jgi:hypothetical protein